MRRIASGLRRDVEQEPMPGAEPQSACATLAQTR